MTNKNSKIREIFENELFLETKEYYSKYSRDRIVIYGAGLCGRKYLSLFNKMGMKENIIALADDDQRKWGKRISGILCNDIETIIKEHSDFIVIICSKFEDKIREKLKQYDVRVIEESKWAFFLRTQWMNALYEQAGENEVCNVWHFFDVFSDESEIMQKKEQLFSYLEDEQSREWVECRVNFLLTGKPGFLKNNNHTKVPEYYDPEYIGEITGDNEVFVDCGAYSGDSILDYLHAVDYKCKHIYGIEADPDSYKLLCNTVKTNKLNNVTAINAAVGAEKGKISFFSDGTIGAKVSEQGNIAVEVARLDDIIDQPVSFIKMDIEGAELDGLKGASEIIRKYKPKMAICIYHKAEDIFDIPQYIHQLVPEYKFKIAAHSNTIFNMVLYCAV